MTPGANKGTERRSNLPRVTQPVTNGFRAWTQVYPTPGVEPLLQHAVKPTWSQSICPPLCPPQPQVPASLSSLLPAPRLGHPLGIEAEGVSSGQIVATVDCQGGMGVGVQAAGSGGLSKAQ